MKKFVLIICVMFSLRAHSQKSDSLDIMIGQMIMVGIGNFNELDRTEPIFHSIRQGHIGGIILFEKNLSNQNTASNLRKIVDFAQSQSQIPLFVSIDEEGGRVNRLKPKYGFAQTVTAQYLGEQDSIALTQQYALQTALLLDSLGINLNYAPSVDVNINTENPVIGKIGRSYSPDYKKVIEQATAVIAMHDSAGVITAIKHFPGHGSSKSDTHLGIADVSDTWSMQEIYPYKSLIDSGKVKMIMTAHIVNRIIDSRKLPATLSDRAINELLRGFLGYDGVVVSDDMQMGAIRDEYGTQDAIKKSILAGVDIIMFANNVHNSDYMTPEFIHQTIKTAVENEEISFDRIQQSYDRIINLKKSNKIIEESKN